MQPALTAALAAVIVGIVVVLVLRRRRQAAGQVRRDAPTTPATATPGIGSRLGGVFRGGIDEAGWGRLHDRLVAVDVGVATATDLVKTVRNLRPADEGAALAALRAAMLAGFADGDRSLRLVGNPAVVVVVGVNGSGKTTTIAKLASRLLAEGRSVLLGAADTFRAAAVDQMRTWGDRLGVDVVAGQSGADPASVAFDAVAAARARGRQVVIVDTAGRLHDKANLMDELAKVIRVLSRDGAVSEVLLVLDGTTGQNGIAQGRAFATAAGVTGVVVSKLDGTARGGIALAIERELGIPIKFVGVGEGAGDLRDFVPEAFVDALLEAP